MAPALRMTRSTKERLNVFFLLRFDDLFSRRKRERDVRWGAIEVDVVVDAGSKRVCRMHSFLCCCGGQPGRRDLDHLVTLDSINSDTKAAFKQFLSCYC